MEDVCETCEMASSFKGGSVLGLSVHVGTDVVVNVQIVYFLRCAIFNKASKNFE